MATWPSTLPPINLPLNIEEQDGIIRSRMDAGPEKIRSRFTATSTYHSFPIEMTGAQYETLMSFYDTNKAISFDMDDPTSGISESFRFRSPPSARVRVGAANADDRILIVNLNLEKLP